MALKHTDSSLKFTLFDAAADGGHIANELLQSSVTQSVRIMKSRSKVAISNTEKTAGAPVGLVIFFKAKPGEGRRSARTYLFIERKRRLYFGSAWSTLTPQVSSEFLDFFTDEEGRKFHLAGKAAQAVRTVTDELLAEPADAADVDVIAAKITARA
ncbi:hypothetical protein EDD18DRAFT_1104203 [Armillaria luteobubalina]|uniref:Uncharacterized protein n=1 Tax=Armillaria luteobubalina TaxID=153913 RepID=A0AA39Q9Y5_9AGAR|nr:hypothetical protein EDD18DRAFT_1104203 [Armillaria luteobubalina]